MDDRRAYHRGPGVALYTDVNAQMLADLATMRPPEIGTWGETVEASILFNNSAAHREIVEDNPAGVSLLATLSCVRVNVPTYTQAFIEKYGITEEDRELANMHAFAGEGFADIDFTWHFSGAIANAVVDYMVMDGQLTQAQKDGFRLHDWADIIEAPWFSDIMHDLAKTRPGTYGSTGMQVGDYHRAFLQKALHEAGLVDSNESPLTTAVYIHPETQEQLKVPVLTDRLREALRRRILRGSAGCPVAHKGITISGEQLETDAHTRRLVADGLWRAAGEPNDRGRVRIEQDETAIGRTLRHIAGQLRSYEDLYGMPRLTLREQYGIDVEHLPVASI